MSKVKGFTAQQICVINELVANAVAEALVATMQAMPTAMDAVPALPAPAAKLIRLHSGIDWQLAVQLCRPLCRSTCAWSSPNGRTRNFWARDDRALGCSHSQLHSTTPWKGIGEPG